MTVSRRHKRGNRANKSMRMACRNGRVRWTGILNKAVGAVDDRPIRNRTSKEEWVVNLVTLTVAGKLGSHLRADDVASDILMELLDQGGFSWEREDIVEFCLKKANAAAKSQLWAREIPECQFGQEEFSSVLRLWAVSPATQDIAFDAIMARRLLKNIPNPQRYALEVLCDGGNPVDVAQELNVTPWEAISIIKEAREYVHRVDPHD